MDPKALRSILGHFIAAFISGFGLVLTGFVGAHPDPATWTLKAFGAALFVGVVALVKKFFAGELLA